MKRCLFPRALLSAAVISAMGAAPMAFAQETSATIRGIVTGINGEPVDKARITVVHTPSNSRSEITSGDSGHFNLSGLRVGGPYRITVESDQGERVLNGIYLTLGDPLSLPVNLDAPALEEVHVVARLEESASTVVGPASHFTRADLEHAPSVNRDLKDLVRLDPRVYIDESYADGIQCAGANPRFNSLTVDGVRMNDNFGLNSNGYPTERMPFSYDAIDQVALELAPFDVQYGGFSACNINAVTKSGSNEWHGSVVYDYTDDGMQGDSLEGDEFHVESFDEQRYATTLSGPIIPDKLFFFTAYEKLDGVDTFERGPAGSGAPTEVQGVSRAQVDEILRIARDVYGYEPGGLPTSLPVEDEKLLVKLDWNISDGQRAAFTYNYNDGFHIAESDGDSDELEFSNHYYERGAELNAYVAQLFSDWSDIFSTELKIGYSELDNRQLSLGGTDFGEVQIRTSNDHDGDGSASRATVYLGADDSRHANKLSYETLTLKLAGNLQLDAHNLYFGYERDTFDVFNMFVQEAEGEYRFNSIEDFAAGIADRITYENAAGSNDPTDAGAEFSYTTNSIYAQDEYQFANVDLTLVAGLRYDWYTSDDHPVENPAVEAAYGIRNTENMDGKDLLQPRLGLNWNVNDRLEIHGGIGLYSGGNPNVWISNNYSNNGVIQLEVQDESGIPLADMDWNGSGRPIYDIPQHLYDQVASGSTSGSVNLMDPDFEIPSSWKYALGGSYLFESGYLASIDLLHSEFRDAAIIRDISLERVGTAAADGRPLYAATNGRRQDYMLTNVNGDSGYATSLSLGLSRSFDFGLDLALGYAYTEAEDVNPMTSSVAFSNYSGVATANAQDPGTATSNYVVPHRFTLKLDYGREFFDGYETRVTLFGTLNEGRPYTYTFEDSAYGSSFGSYADRFRQLLYVPSGESDPGVVFGDDFDTEAFFAWADKEGLDRGRIVERNELTSDWWSRLDLRINQELPGFRAGDRANAYFVVENLGNLLNDDWGVMVETGFPLSQAAVKVSMDEQNRYVFEEFLDPAGQTRVAEPSFWKARLGIRYQF